MTILAKVNWGRVAAFLRWLSQDPDTRVPFLGWLIAAVIETVIISLIVGLVAEKVCDKEFDDWFSGSCIVVGILEIILYLCA